MAKTSRCPVCINFCFIGIKHFCSIEVVPWMDPLNEQSRPLFRPRTRRKEDSRSLDNNGSSSFSLVIRCMFDGREDGKPFFDFERLHSETFYEVSIRYHLLLRYKPRNSDAIRPTSIYDNRYRIYNPLYIFHKWRNKCNYGLSYLSSNLINIEHFILNTIYIRIFRSK